MVAIGILSAYANPFLLIKLNYKAMNALNPYKITWFTLIPLKGVVTLRDQVKVDSLNKWYSRKGRLQIDVPSYNKQKALDKLDALKGKLSKPYRVYVYTDKQFGMRKGMSNVIDVLTTKQKEESFILK